MRQGTHPLTRFERATQPVNWAFLGSGPAGAGGTSSRTPSCCTSFGPGASPPLLFHTHSCPFCPHVQRAALSVCTAAYAVKAMGTGAASLPCCNFGPVSLSDGSHGRWPLAAANGVLTWQGKGTIRSSNVHLPCYLPARRRLGNSPYSQPHLALRKEKHALFERACREHSTWFRAGPCPSLMYVGATNCSSM